MKIRSDLMSEADANVAGIETKSSEKITDDLNVVQREFNNFVADIESLAQHAMSVSADDLDGLREKLRQRVQRAKTLVKETGEVAGESVLQYACKTAAVTSRYVRDRPGYGLAIGAVAVVALGMVLLYRGPGQKSS
jgi:ElaB/YqjD/DUF883 family membrane-anchored ribosome-binding protein